MFDLGFSKIAVIGAVALIVLGPERLPRIARVAGALFGRAQRYVRDVKAEVSRDMALTELSELKDLGEHVRQELDGAKHALQDSLSDARNSFQDKTHAVGQPYTRQPFFQPVRRNGRQSWRIKSSQIPLWFKHHQHIKTRITSEAARMSRHRRYAAHVQTKHHSFFN